MLKRTLVMALAGSQMLVSGLIMAEEDRSAVLERIKPVGTVTVEGQEMPVITKTEVAPPAAAETVAAPAAPVEAAAPAAAPVQAASVDGAAVYQQACFACHDTGAAGAPKRGDKAAWAPRLATGKDALMHSALNGKGAMPPKGGRADFSNEQISAGVDYLMQAAQ